MAKFLIMGYIGRGNAGDDLMLVSLVELLRGSAPGSEITVAVDTVLPPSHRYLSAVRVIPRRPWQVLLALMRSDVLVWAGGSFLHDVVGRRTYVRQLLLSVGLVSIARSLRRRVWLLGVGVGPVKTWWGARLVRSLIRLSDLVVTRDSDSESRIRTLVPTHQRLASTLDLSLPGLTAREESARFSGIGSVSRNAPLRRLCVSLVPTQYLYGFGVSDKTLIEEVKWGLLLAQEVLGSFEVSVFAFNRETDSRMASALAAALQSEGIAARAIFYLGDPLVLFEEVRRCWVALNMRYHGIVYSFAANQPQVVLAYHLKCTQLATEIGVDPTLVLDPLQWQRDNIARALVRACAQRQPYSTTPEHASQHVARTVRKLLSDLYGGGVRTA